MWLTLLHIINLNGLDANDRKPIKNHSWAYAKYFIVEFVEQNKGTDVVWRSGEGGRFVASQRVLRSFPIQDNYSCSLIIIMFVKSLTIAWCDPSARFDNIKEIIR